MLTVTTNMVVALMIVTRGFEPVPAYPQLQMVLERDRPSYAMPCEGAKTPLQAEAELLAQFQNVRVGPANEVETLYRPVCRTNFVFGAALASSSGDCYAVHIGKDPPKKKEDRK